MSRRAGLRTISRLSAVTKLSLAFASALFVVVAPLAARSQIPRPKVPIPRELITIPEYMRPGQHTLSLDVAHTLPRSAAKTYTGSCGHFKENFPGVMNGSVGWGQTELSSSSPCGSQVFQLAVTFDTTNLDKISEKVIDRAVLTYDEAQAAYCPLLQGVNISCWQSGRGVRENKPNGCAVVRVPTINWIETAPPPGLIPYAGARPTVSRISVREWDVTEPVLWQKQKNAAQLGAFATYGFLLSGGPSLDQLTAEDSTVCISTLSNIKLHVTYTVPPEGKPFQPPR
ncbi:hypothetical protein H6F89_31660 [Cyanobacteria bacterium FACHB-63]|nr:hypothetical protein [Cyanobacteria bacterium FACHB-63]